MPPTAPPPPPTDLFDYVYRSWVTAGDPNDIQREAVLGFINHGITLLQSNQPVGVDHLSACLALRLQDLTVVPLVREAASPVTGPSSVAVPITRPQAHASGDMAPARSW